MPDANVTRDNKHSKAAIPPVRRRHGKNGFSLARRRCRMACIPCRNRKVRCDVEQQDSAPCTNCRLDQEACIIQNRVRQSKIAYQQNFNLSTPDGVAAWSALQKSLAQGDGNTAQPIHQPESVQDSPPHHEQVQTCDIDTEPVVETPLSTPIDEQIPRRAWSDRRATSVRISNTDSSVARPTTTNFSINSSRAEIGHFYYPFLSIDRVSLLPLEDFQYLESLSCFQIPLRHLLDEIMQAYFRYVHPHLPILSEADFWRMYSGDNTKDDLKISLFVFHAMISSACGFISSATACLLGFQDIRAARTSFYRRAKALFHMDVNRDMISSAQGALLLTYYITTTDARLNTYWLSNAVCYAKLALGPSQHTLRTRSKQVLTLKRLWWCCLVRDRIMSLALRRSVQISLHEAPCPGFDDDELNMANEESSVYPWKAKKDLIISFTALCDLVVVLGDILIYLSTIKKNSGRLSSRFFPQACSQRLDDWLVKTKARLGPSELAAESVQLHNNVLYIYYHASHAALWNQAIYSSVIGKVPLHAHFSEGRMRLESALRGIDQSLKTIQEVGLLDYMPIAVSAFIALPMVWHILTTKLSKDSGAADTRARLAVYFSAMNAFKVRSDGTDAVLFYIKNLVSCFKASEHARPHAQSKDYLNAYQGAYPDHWTDILTNQPQYFIRTTLTVELALSRGQYPVEEDFPTTLTTENGESSADEESQPRRDHTTAVSADHQMDDLFLGSDTPAMWTLGIFDSFGGDTGRDTRQAQLQDVLSRFEQADYHPTQDMLPYESPFGTDSAFFNELIDNLECL